MLGQQRLGQRGAAFQHPGGSFYRVVCRRNQRQHSPVIHYLEMRAGFQSIFLTQRCRDDAPAFLRKGYIYY